MVSYDEILKRMTEKFTSLAGYSPDDASDIGIRMKVLAGEIYSISSAVDWLKTQTFAQTAQGEQLELRAQERGITRKQPVAASGTLVFRRNSASWCSAVIPLGTVCSTNGDQPIRYVTTQEATLLKGALSIAVPARAEQAGSAGNALSGTVTVMVTPPPAMESVTNLDAFTGGEDSESDGELRSRLMQSYASISNGTNAAFYRECALKYEGVHSVGVVPRENGAGTVSLYLGGKGEAPAAEIIARVQDDLNKLREVNVSVKVAAAQTVPVNIGMVVTPVKNIPQEEAYESCRNAIREYFDGLAVGEPVILTALGVAAYATGKITNYAFSSGITDKSIKGNQLAVCGTVSVSYYAGVQG